MTIFLQTCAAVLLAVIMILAQGKQANDMAALISLAVCSMASLIALQYLGPVIDFLEELQVLGGLSNAVIRILLKAAGIGMISEIAALVCSDAGNNSMGKTIQLLGTAVILWLCVPLFSMLIELMQEILGEL